MKSEGNQYIHNMCRSCPLMCYGVFKPNPGLALYCCSFLSALAGCVMIFGFDFEVGMGFVWFPILPIVFAVLGEKASRRMVRQMRKGHEARAIYFVGAVAFSFFLVWLTSMATEIILKSL